MNTTANTVTTTNDTQKYKIRALVSNYYDLQKLRIQAGNRIVASYMDLGEKSRKRTSESVKEEANDTDKAKHEKEEMKLIAKLTGEYYSITDAFSKLAMEKKRKPKIDTVISEVEKDNKLELIKTEFDYSMAQYYMSIKDSEETVAKAIEKEVVKHPMWNAFFKDVKGCGPLIAANCISYFDIDKGRHASAFWKYAGLDVIVTDEGKAEGHNKKHLVDQQYTDKNGDIQTKKGLGYNPILKAKLAGVLADSFIKCCKNGEGYRKAYEDYRNRLDNREDTKDFTNMHKHNMARRFAVKQFVRDMWIVWNELAGYPPEPTYEEAFLGRKHHGYNRALEK